MGVLDRLCCNETKHAGGPESDEEDRADGVGKTTRRGDEHEQQFVYKEIERINRLLPPCHGMSPHTRQIRTRHQLILVALILLLC